MRFRFSALRLLPALLRPGAALSGAGADKIAFDVRQAARHSNHRPPGAGAGVSPRLRQRTELRLRVPDLLDDGKQVKGAAGQAVDAATVTTSPGARACNILRSSRRSARAPVTFSR
jgi:hypothetical protein